MGSGRKGSVNTRGRSKGNTDKHRAVHARASRPPPTKARLLTRDSERRENVVIPADFWWAEGHEALDQNWAVGDFSTWIDKRIEYRALGVCFSLDNLRDMLAPELAATLARQLSVTSDAAWVTAKATRAFVYGELGKNSLVAGDCLIDQRRLGFVAARAVSMQRATANVQMAGVQKNASGTFPTGIEMISHRQALHH